MEQITQQINEKISADWYLRGRSIGYVRHSTQKVTSKIIRKILHPSVKTDYISLK